MEIMEEEPGPRTVETNPPQVFEYSQPVATQEVGLNTQTVSASGLTEAEELDIICTLCPTGPSAFQIVQKNAERVPQHVFRSQPLSKRHEKVVATYEHVDILVGADKFMSSTPQATPEIAGQVPEAPGELALRLSSPIKVMELGFTFGREERKSDIIISPDGGQPARVSAMHFRIFINSNGIIMLEDTSTNGTIVDNQLLKHKKPLHGNPVRRIISHGSIIEFFVDNSRKTARFIVKIPERRDQTRWQERLQAYLAEVRRVQNMRMEELRNLKALPQPDSDRRTGRVKAVPDDFQHLQDDGGTALLAAGTINSNHGMRWHGGGKYRTMNNIGSGAFATVYRVVEIHTGRDLAVKEIEKRRIMKSGASDIKIGQELQILKMMKHAHIIDFIDHAETARDLYIVMEFVPYGDLSQHINNLNRLSDEDHRHVAKQLCHALAYMHDNGVAHRDIKPENLVKMSKFPIWIKVADFGLSKMIGQGEPTLYQTFCGTLLYCAPEIYPGYAEKRRGENVNNKKSKTEPYSVAVDIWSMAAVMFHLVCATPPYQASPANHGVHMLDAILKTRFPTDKIESAQVHSDWDLFFENSLQISPTLRWSARHLLNLPIMQATSDVRPIIYEYRNQDTRFAFEEVSDAEMNESPSIVEEDSMDYEEGGLDASQLSLHDNSNASELEQDEGDQDEDSSMSGIEDIATTHNGLGIQGLQEVGSRYQLRSRGGPTTTQVLPASSPRKKKSNPRSEAFTPVVPQQAGMLFGEIGDSGVFGSAANTPHIVNTAQVPSLAPISETVEYTGPAAKIAAHVTRTTARRFSPVKHDNIFASADSAASLRGAEGQIDKLRMATPEMDLASLARARVSPSSSLGAKHQLVEDDEQADPRASMKRSRIEEPALSMSSQTSQALQNDQKRASKTQTSDRPRTPEATKSTVSDNQETPRARKAGVKSLVFSDNPASSSSSSSSVQESNGNESHPELPATAVAQTFPNGTGMLPVLDPAAIMPPPPRRSSHASSRPPTPLPQMNPENPSVPALGVLERGHNSTPAIPVDKIYVTLQKTEWGRAPDCTHIYNNPSDSRIAKSAFTIQLWDPATGRRGASNPNTDWTKAHFYAVISTRSSRPIFVNDVPITRKMEGKHPIPLGLLYTGDKITVWHHDREHLSFYVHFWFGAASAKRDTEHDQFRVLMGEKELTKAIHEAETKRSDRTIKA